MGVDTPIKDYMGRWIVVDRAEDLRRANYVEIEVKRVIRPDGAIEEKIFRIPRQAGGPDA
jgi:hypothetical protein